MRNMDKPYRFIDWLETCEGASAPGGVGVVNAAEALHWARELRAAIDNYVRPAVSPSNDHGSDVRSS